MSKTCIPPQQMQRWARHLCVFTLRLPHSQRCVRARGRLLLLLHNNFLRNCRHSQIFRVPQMTSDVVGQLDEMRRNAKVAHLQCLLGWQAADRMPVIRQCRGEGRESEFLASKLVNTHIFGVCIPFNFLLPCINIL